MARKHDRYTYGTRAPRHKSTLLRIFDLVVFILTIIAAVLLVCAYVSRYINPNDTWFFAFVGMGAPILYIVNLLFALYWVVRWKIFALVPIVVLLVGIGWISLFFRPTLSKKYPGERAGTTLVMSYNVAGFLSDSQTSPTVSTLDSIAAFTGRINPDILCIQEFQNNTEKARPHIDSMLSLPYNRHNYKVPNTNGGGWGLAIYSRFRIINSGVVDFEQSTNSAMWVDLLVKSDTLRVFNCHLQTTSVNQSDLEYITRQEYLDEDETKEGKVKSIAVKLRNNFRRRAVQADSLSVIIRQSPYKVIVCGDFNDTPMSYVYNVIRGDMKDAFVEKGSGIPNTYKGLFNLFRIDYIFHSRQISTVSYSTPTSDYSDHKPVIAGLDI